MPSRWASSSCSGWFRDRLLCAGQCNFATALGGDTAARRVEQEPTNWSLLALLLLLTNSMNYLATFGLGGLLAHLATNEGLAIAIEALVITPLVFVLGESLPKEIFRRHADRLVYTLSAPLPILRWAATMVLLLPFVQTMQAWPAASREAVWSN